METQAIAKQFIEFQKSAFNNTFDAMVMLQDQTEKTASSFWANDSMPQEGKKMIDEWVKAFKKGRDEFKKAVDDNFSRLESMLTQSK